MRRPFIHRILNLFLVIMLLSLGAGAAGAGPAQAAAPDQQVSQAQTSAEALLSAMTPEEKVGQLFLVTFKGTDMAEGSQIYSLIFNHHVGGVTLLDSNDNFTANNNNNLAADVYNLISQLQGVELMASQTQTVDQSGKATPTAYIPLFVAVSQEGDGYPYDQLLSGLTPLPSPMAIGATWKTSLATQVGSVLGSELQALGFNMLLGPSLDVLELLKSGGFNDLGVATFGGDPFWVGEMGRAYIAGLHTGSNNRLAVVATHFPGRGGSDRPPEEEVATVRKSLEQLKQIELAPFIAVTGNAPDANSTADGLLVSHIRYQGFQGNIRDTTKPVSLDPAALSQLMSLPAPGFSSWRDNGGLLVSDDLGSRAVRRFFDPSEKTFDASQVARSAFLAGNDLLFVDNFVTNGDPDAYTTIVHTLDLFAQKYREDSAFAQRVDASVTRLLTLKYRLYPNFNYRTVLPSDFGLGQIDKSQAVTFDVARQAVTLISPSPAELDSVLPKPPELRESMVFFTDTQIGKQCTHCPDIPVMSADTLQNAILRLYGPQVGGQVRADRVSSYSFTDLEGYLENRKNVPRALIEADITESQWVVFTILDVQPGRPDSLALKNLLSMRPDLLRNKKVIVFAFNAPYFLDATDISKLTAYYALYSKAPAFIDVAARVLFQELPITGALPVSVPGIGYDLIEATSPDPTQTIPVFLDVPDQPPAANDKATPTLAPTPAVRFNMGDTIPLRAGIIYDHNHNPVPDKTVVQFTFTYSGENGSTQQVSAFTSQGIARTTFRVEKSGPLEINVISDPANNSDVLRFTIPAVVQPTSTPVTPTATQTVTPSPTVTQTVTPTATPTPALPRGQYPNVTEWWLGMALIAAGAALAYGLGNWWWGSLRWGVRWMLCASMGGILGYLYVAAGLPGSKAWVQGLGTPGIMGVALMGVVAGWIIAVGWWIIAVQLLGRRMQRSR